eukprot:437696_1
MSTRSSLEDNLCSYIDNACSVKDLESILCSIPIESIKTFVKGFIKSMTQCNCDALAVRCCPITDILDINVIQYILSFILSGEVNAINKLFNCLSIKNDHIFLTKKLDAKYESVHTTVNKHQLQYLKLQRSSSLLSQSISKTRATLWSLQRRKRVTDESMKEAVTASYNALKSIHTKHDDNTINYDQYFAPLKAIKHITDYNHIHLIRPRRLANHEYDNRRIHALPIEEECSKISFDVSGCLALKDECDYTDAKCQQLGYKGPYDNLHDHLSQFKSGDKVLLANGVYNGLATHDFSNIDLQFVGLGEYVIFRFYRGHFFTLTGKSNVYFKNIKFDIVDGYCCGFDELSCIEIKDGSCLWMNRCDVKYADGAAINCCPDTKLYVKTCSFSAGGKGLSGSTLVVSPWAKNVNIINCLFANCGRTNVTNREPNSCIEVQDIDYDRYDEDLVKLKCLGNTFANNFGFTASKMGVCVDEFESSKWFNEFDERFYELKGNQLQGVNGLNIDQVIDDPNKLYQHQYN